MKNGRLERFGKGLEKVWKRFGKGLEKVWERFGKDQSNVWKHKTSFPGYLRGCKVWNLATTSIFKVKIGNFSKFQTFFLDFPIGKHRLQANFEAQKVWNLAGTPIIKRKMGNLPKTKLLF
jgi:hypothetical protein